MNEQQIAAAALEFLSRTQLRGAEAEPFIVVRNWLAEKATGATPADTSESGPAT